MSIRVRRALLAVVGMLVLAQPALAQDKWSLWSSGRIQLRGANAFQRRVYPAIDGADFIGPGPVGPPYCPVTPPDAANCAPGQNDFQSLKNEGANVVQISGPGIYSENLPYVLDQPVRDNLDGLIAKAAAAGLKVVISFRTGPGRSEGAFNYLPPAYDNETVWADTAAGTAARNAWVAMWIATANYYKNNPNVVAYEMMVEPNGNDKSFGDFDPAHFYAVHPNSGADWNPLAAAITTGI